MGFDGIVHLVQGQRRCGHQIEFGAPEIERQNLIQFGGFLFDCDQGQKALQIDFVTIRVLQSGRQFAAERPRNGRMKRLLQFAGRRRDRQVILKHARIHFQLELEIRLGSIAVKIERHQDDDHHDVPLLLRNTFISICPLYPFTFFPLLSFLYTMAMFYLRADNKSFLTAVIFPFFLTAIPRLRHKGDAHSISSGQGPMNHPACLFLLNDRILQHF